MDTYYFNQKMGRGIYLPIGTSTASCFDFKINETIRILRELVINFDWTRREEVINFDCKEFLINLTNKLNISDFQKKKFEHFYLEIKKSRSMRPFNFVIYV